MAPDDEVRSLLNALGQNSAHELQTQTVGGGCISEAMQIRWQDADGGEHQLFAKRNQRSFEDNFRCEIAGLQQLAETQTIRVPEPMGVFALGDTVWLVTEWIERGDRPRDFFERFGRDLARLHQATRGDAIGWDRDNYLGAARQPNASASDWVQFVAEQRLGFQIRWASEQGLADGQLRRDVDAVIDRLPSLLQGREPSTSLLHGDLWSGNYFSDVNGNAVILDPAVYYGCREAEWGMIALFGSCPAVFAEAYQAQSPLPDGWQRRIRVYVLYHLLNHLNLFGRSYASQCASTAADLLRK